MKKQYYTYILLCSDNSYYTGVTNNLEKRILEHQKGINECYTFFRRPVELVFFESFVDINQAINFEKQIKGWSRKKKEALIKQNFIKLKELSECKNNTSYKHASTPLSMTLK